MTPATDTHDKANEPTEEDAMSTTESESTPITLKQVAEEDIHFATVTEVTEGLPATKRCDRDGAQAYVEVEMSGRRELLFCAHHYEQHEVALGMKAVRIIDHRPFLQIQERKFKGQ